MRFKSVFVLVLLCGLWPAKASADNRFIVRTTLDLETLQTVCNLPLLPCTVVRGLGDPGGQLFLITSPLDLDELLALPLGIVDAEVDFRKLFQAKRTQSEGSGVLDVTVQEVVDYLKAQTEVQEPATVQ